MMVSQEAAIIGQVSYHDYRGLLIDAQEREQIARALGPSNKVSKSSNNNSNIIQHTKHHLDCCGCLSTPTLAFVAQCLGVFYVT